MAERGARRPNIMIVMADLPARQSLCAAMNAAAAEACGHNLPSGISLKYFREHMDWKVAATPPLSADQGGR